MNRKAKTIGAAVLLVGAILLLVVRLAGHRGAPRPTAAARKIVNELDETVAKEAAALAGNGGRVVLLGFRTASIGDPGPVELLARLSARLREAGLDVAPPVIEVVPLDGLEARGQPLTPADWARVLKAHGDARLAISFAGAPRLTAAQFRTLPTPRPKLLVVLDSPTESADPARYPLVDTFVYRRLDAKDGEPLYGVLRRR